MVRFPLRFFRQLLRGNRKERTTGHRAPHLHTPWNAGDPRYPNAVPHYGEDLFNLAKEVTSTPPPAEYADEYYRIKPHFDVIYYLTRYKDVSAAHIDPILHYIKTGASEDRDPTPWFSSRHYLNVNKDVTRKYRGTPFDHWIRYGRAEGRIGMPFDISGMDAVLGHSYQDIEAHHIQRHNDIRERLAFGELGRMVKLASELDPAVATTWSASFRLRLLPISTARITNRIASLYRFQAALDWRRAKVVVVTETADGDNSLAESLLTSAISAAGEAHVVHLRTEPNQPGSHLCIDAQDVRRLWFSRQSSRQVDDNCRVLADLLRSLKPNLIVCIDSTLTMKTLRIYGRALRASCKIIATLPQPRTDRYGHPALGPEAATYRLLTNVDALVCNTAEEREAVIKAQQLPEADSERVVSWEHISTIGGLASFVQTLDRGRDA